jgi:hypothetical protein
VSTTSGLGIVVTVKTSHAGAIATGGVATGENEATLKTSAGFLYL